ncbi:tRNA wybutosine-synthesizing protein 5 [Lamellibrachia satsuma]|nr:tRNA wybutosine-synthesizing protein 5 [Lamellibrachia satsuma]
MSDELPQKSHQLDDRPEGLVRVYDNVSACIFLEQICPQRVPAILCDLDIGPCRHKWSWSYLEQVGGQREVRVHVGSNVQMDFLHKNFAYRSLPFAELVRRVAQTKHSNYFFSEDEKYYLRSLGKDPRKDTADLQKDFPELAADIKLPAFFDDSQFFSSVLRLSSSGLQLWTHYDVMDNVLMVVSGRKRVVLFPPRDALFLYLIGDKSEVLDIDKPDMEKFPEFSKVTRYECVIGPGDVLYIPALWFHNVINLEAGVAVNVFWRHLAADFYEKDIYGNKDPVLANRATQMLDRALKLLDGLPKEYSDFYAKMMVRKIEKKTYASDS